MCILMVVVKKYVHQFLINTAVECLLFVRTGHWPSPETVASVPAMGFVYQTSPNSTCHLLHSPPFLPILSSQLLFSLLFLLLLFGCFSPPPTSLFLSSPPSLLYFYAHPSLFTSHLSFLDRVILFNPGLKLTILPSPGIINMYHSSHHFQCINLF